MSQITYEASVFSAVVNYKNFKGQEKSTELHFALDPIQLMQTIASFAPKNTRSKNPAKQGAAEISDEEQIKFVRGLACKAAGFPSDDGESWEPFEDFENSIAGKTFLTQLVSSDGARKDFAERVILDPFKAFVEFAEADPTNTKSETQQLRTMLAQLENVFIGKTNESLEERRARLQAEMAALESQTD